MAGFGEPVIRRGEKRALTNETVRVPSDVVVEAGATLALSGATLLFAPGAGIVCFGRIEAKDASFKCSSGEERWGAIALAGPGAAGSVFSGCRFERSGGILAEKIASGVAEGTLEEYDYADATTGEKCHLGGALTFAGVTGERSSVSGCVFGDCTTGAGGKGGAVFVTGSSVAIDSCRFLGCNSRHGNGGGIEIMYSEAIDVRKCDFTKCTASNDGGGMRIYESSGMVDSCRFFECSAGFCAGGLEFGGGDPGADGPGAAIVVKYCVFKDCSSGTAGGGAAGSMGAAAVTLCSFIGCTAATAGGGLCVDRLDLSIDHCEFKNCAAGDEGGSALYIGYEIDGDGRIEDQIVTAEDLSLRKVAFEGCAPPVVADNSRFGTPVASGGESVDGRPVSAEADDAGEPLNIDIYGEDDDEEPYGRDEDPDYRPLPGKRQKKWVEDSKKGWEGLAAKIKAGKANPPDGRPTVEKQRAAASKAFEAAGAVVTGGKSAADSVREALWLVFLLICALVSGITAEKLGLGGGGMRSLLWFMVFAGGIFVGVAAANEIKRSIPLTAAAIVAVLFTVLTAGCDAAGKPTLVTVFWCWAAVAAFYKVSLIYFRDGGKS